MSAAVGHSSGQASEAAEPEESTGEDAPQEPTIRTNSQPWVRMEELAAYDRNAETPPARLLPWMERFLAVLRVKRNISTAAKEAGIRRDYAYLWRGKCKMFAEAWKEAEAVRVDGIAEQVFDMAEGGDPRLVEFILKSLRREEWGDKLEVNVSGALAHVALSSDDVARIVAEMHPELAPRALLSQSQG